MRTAQIEERQHRQRRLLGNRRSRFGGGVVGGRWPRLREQPVAAPGDGHDPAFPVPVFGERSAQRRDVHLDVVFLDDDPDPHPLHQLVFADDLAPGRGQYTEDVKRPPAEPHQSFIAPQLATREVKPEPAELISPSTIGLIPLEKKLSSQPKKLTAAPFTVHRCVGQGPPSRVSPRKV